MSEALGWMTFPSCLSLPLCVCFGLFYAPALLATVAEDKNERYPVPLFNTHVSHAIRLDTNLPLGMMYEVQPHYRG